MGPRENSTTVMQLSEDERAMLAGEAGEAPALAMRIVARLAPLYGASSLIPVTRAHIDGCIYSGDAGLAYAERLSELGAKVAVPTSLNVVSLDRAGWQDLGMDANYAGRARRIAEAYLAMGAQPTFTCAPYHTVHAPTFGEQIAWSESNAVAYANSVIGARTNRYGDFLDIACAITGRVPAAGLHLEEHRLASHVVHLGAMPPGLVERDDFYPVLGYHLGSMGLPGVAVIAGLDAQPTQDQLKALCAAAASSGEVALVHIAGITPEAPTVEAALGGRPPVATHRVSLDDLRRTRAVLSTTTGGPVDVVAFGSPHCSLSECRELAALMNGSRCADGVTVFISTSRAVREILARTGDLATLEEFGCRVTADTCIVVAPLVPEGSRVLMTNSGKYAHYGPGLLGVDTVFGSTAACVASAISGTIEHEASPWE